MPDPADRPSSAEDVTSHDEQTEQAGSADETATEFTLDVEMPADALFDLEEYLEMYEVAAEPKRFKILVALADESRLSTSELSMLLDAEGNDLHYPLRRLTDVGLIENRRDPTTGTEEPYSYYELTEMARTILTEGVLEGVETLAAQEAALEDTYSK
jgi:DNA-binding transcriptional ArsR family regulator